MLLQGKETEREAEREVNIGIKRINKGDSNEKRELMVEHVDAL